jgi:hypothetical protein
VTESAADSIHPIPSGDRRLSIGCARCDGTAAELHLLAAGSGRDEVLADRDRLVRRGFLGEATYVRSLDALLRLYQVIARGDLREAHNTEPDVLGFFCPDCDAAYCERCWDICPPEFDDERPEFYDCTHATCPAGHRQIVDD